MLELLVDTRLTDEQLDFARTARDSGEALLGITSVSLEVWKIEPCCSRRRRSWPALTRLPLCTRASGPMEVLTTIGWALVSTLSPVVE